MIVVFSVRQTTNIRILDSDDATLLLKVYNIMHPDISFTFNDMSQLIQKFGRITVGTTTFGSKMESRSVRSSRILASWHSKDGTINVETFSLTPRYSEIFFQACCELTRIFHSSHICMYEVVQSRREF